MRHIFILIIFIISSLSIVAQEDAQTVKKGFVIVAAGKNYSSIRKKAELVAEDLSYKLDFRGLSQDSIVGLTLSKKEAEENGWEFPMYYSRGRFDDGNYVSVEYTDAYNTFTPGYYIIVVSSFSKGDIELKKSLKYVETKYKSAYVKYADVYIGCMH